MSKKSDLMNYGARRVPQAVQVDMKAAVYTFNKAVWNKVYGQTPAEMKAEKDKTGG